ncbi:MAG: hypothetical protein MUC50_21055 [Myxococcota bacterium]|nr:hypothetical protein [Myxococcota bacterium]
MYDPDAVWVPAYDPDKDEWSYSESEDCTVQARPALFGTAREFSDGLPARMIR